MRTSVHPHSPRAAGRRQRGFSLVEVLIGLLIAMIGVVIMMEVLITSEQRARTTGTGNDAMSNGAIMMHLLQRDLVQAGYGINSKVLLGCNLKLPNGKKVPIAPISIYKAGDSSTVVPAGDANTDRLLVMYGSDSGQPEGNKIYSIAGAVYTVQAPSAFTAGDYVVAVPDSCAGDLTLAKITATDANTVTVDVAEPTATTLYNLGSSDPARPSPRFAAYAVRNGSLTQCDYLAADCTQTSAANWTAVGSNIVALRAQYGRNVANAVDGGVDTWDQTTPDTSCKWVRTTAVRYVLVSKSTQYETTIGAGGQRVCEVVTGGQPNWNGATGAPVDLTRGGAVTDWQCYRYRTFENVAPSRNVVWMGGNSGC